MDDEDLSKFEDNNRVLNLTLRESLDLISDISICSKYLKPELKKTIKRVKRLKKKLSAWLDSYYSKKMAKGDDSLYSCGCVKSLKIVRFQRKSGESRVLIF